MNVYQAMGQVVNYAISYLDIVPDTAANNADVAAVCQMLDAYDALAPDWDSAPEWAQWYTIDANGEAVWCRDEPTAKEHWASMWGPITVRLRNAPIVTLPLGIDWRLCKWQRPKVTA